MGILKLYKGRIRKYNKLSNTFGALVLVGVFFLLGFVGNVETNVNASLKICIIECVITLGIMSGCTFLHNYYKSLSDTYSEKYNKKFKELKTQETQRFFNEEIFKYTILEAI